MADTLAQLITKVQALLGDTYATFFTASIVTAGIRQALNEWNLRVPYYATANVTGIANQYEYDFTTAQTTAIEILDIFTGDESINYTMYIKAGKLYFRLATPLGTTDTMIVAYTKPHTINGLDSETVSTLTTFDDQAIVDGAAFYSIVTRATARIETVNVSGGQPDDYAQIAQLYKMSFDARLINAARRKEYATAEPDLRAWNDDYHTWEQ